MTVPGIGAEAGVYRRPYETRQALEARQLLSPTSLCSGGPRHSREESGGRAGSALAMDRARSQTHGASPGQYWLADIRIDR
jgi:hypothetical protein